MSGRAVELAKALVIAAVGLAMLLGPGLGSDADDAGAIAQLVAWAWGPLLGALFTVVGVVGLVAVARTAGRSGAAAST